jgi:hypothetical protein
LGDGTANYSSSDEESGDRLHIMLNEDAGAPLPPAAHREGYVTEDEDGEDLGSHVKGPSVNNGSLGKVCILNYRRCDLFYIPIDNVLGLNCNLTVLI